MDSIIYVSFGSGPHRHQLVHAILSARALLRNAARDRRCQIVVYTDDPVSMKGLDVKVHPLTREMLADWRGPRDFIYRPKVIAIRHALANFGGRVIYCDADTYFLKPPRRLFDRIGPGRSVMHAGEDSPHRLGIAELCAVLREHEFRMLDGRRWNISEHTVISNAGVIGLHEADLPLVDETLHLVDQMCIHLDYFGTEQFAFSACLSGATLLRHSSDIVHHYWLPDPRDRFQAHLSRALDDPDFGSFDDRYRYLRRVRARALNRPETIWGRTYATLWSMASKMHVVDALKRTASIVRRNAAHLFALLVLELAAAIP